MPSNSKQKKKQSKLLQQSSLSSNAATTPSKTLQPSELASLCEEASRKFPSLIAKSAFIAELAQVDDTVPVSNRIWLSAPSMLSLSLPPGSTVSVSIPSWGEKISQLHSFPLASLANECEKLYGLESSKALDDYAGNYLVLATVFPSSKVLKNGVRLSSNLYHAMGCPALGTSVFVHPISSAANGINEQHSTGNSCLSIYNCKELYLQLVPSKNGLPLKFNNFPSLGVSKVKFHVQSENDIVASPATPSNGSKFSNACGMSSPLFDNSASSLPNQNSQSLNSFDVSLALGNESSKELLLTGAMKQPVTKSDHYPSNGNGDLYPEDSDIADSGNQAFTVNDETKVFLSLPSNTASEEPIQRDIPCVKLECRVANASLHDKISKLGGLSKEYTLLKGIISSSVSDALSSEQQLHEVFDSAIQAAPAVVFIDELDAIAPARKDGGEELSQRLVATLLNLVDGISRSEGSEGLLVIAATNRPDHIEPALRRPGRFDKEIEIGVPSPDQRSDILLTLLSEMDHTLSEFQIEHLGTATHGFVGADLAALCNEAALICLRHYANFKKTYGSCSDYITEQPALMNSATNSRDHSGDAISSVSDVSGLQSCVTFLQSCCLHQRVNVTVIAATNRPDKIDPALLRPGRFDRLLYVGPPNEVDREEIFRIHLCKIPCGSDVSLKELARLTDGCTGADISLICREAAVAAIEERLDASVITMEHLKMAIKQIQPSEVHSYQKLSTKFQRAVHCCYIKNEFNDMQCDSRSTQFNIW
ncbi:Calmodulin-interacting protein 111 [Glycine soja]|uniref:Calmodulin-interacting protein 111 n=1 Tax=Glycine soja TaxID=3848 RepID=A0A0B2PMX1_GLYSO|nr:Calmodulin-interacting protein 111 [Glycine soja]